ncbi:hypothetical protein DYB37_000047 [Aphanomyces astaci]|uniref:Fanconi Anaemia group E protein C-terminal domain-containing protein n=1 Tax=Aphanomyces astaci TaxID=112090 RepID=A0A3R7F5P2_APHAT|nr:hypothetical protein DYB35_003378 [Aphanomyces astaci]RHZ24719.1 hypothetical protein DYB37_000047 [Aphanomyces astaci]
MELRATLVAAAVNGGVHGVAAHIDDHVGDLHSYLSCVLDAQDLPLGVKRVIWSGMVHRATRFAAAMDATRTSHALTLISAVETDRYVNHLARLVFQAQKPPPPAAWMPSVDTCVIARMSVPTCNVSTGKRAVDVDLTKPSSPSTPSSKRIKLDDDHDSGIPAAPLDPIDPIDDITYLAMKMDKRASASQILALVSSIKSTPSSSTTSDIASRCDAILHAASSLLQLPEYCSTPYLELLCSTLALTSLSDDAVLVLTTKLVEAKWTSYDTAVVLESTLLVRVQAATSAIPRSLLKALQVVATSLPHIAIDRILVPVLTSATANAPQCEAMTRLVRDGLGPSLTPLIVTRLIAANVLHSPHDRVLLVVQQIFNVKAPLAQDAIDLVVHALARAVSASPATTTASIKFASVLFTVVTKYAALCVRHRDALLAIATKCTSSMAKTALRAIDKLA